MWPSVTATTLGRARTGLLVLLVLTTVAAAPQPFAWMVRGSFLAKVVEQQSPGGALCETDCVVNTTACPVWDADESIRLSADGVLDGASTYETCLVADWVDHLIHLEAISGQRNQSVTATIHVADPNRPVTVTASGPQIRMCVISPDYDNESVLLGPVADGVGVVDPVMFTVANPNDHPLRKASALAGIRPGHNQSLRDFYCGDILTCIGHQVPGLDPKVCWGVAIGT